MARLKQADRAWQGQRAMALFLRNWKWLLALFLLGLLLDLVFHLSSHTRLSLTLLTIATLITLGAWLIHFAWFKTNPPERIARHLEDRSPLLGSRLINFLQLRRSFLDAPHSSALTRSLAAQAEQDAAAATHEIKFLPLTREPQLRRLAWHAAIPSLALLLLAAFFHAPFFTLLVRYLDPLGDHPPYSLTQLHLESPGPQGATTLYRAGFTVKAGWSGHDPKELLLTAHPPGQPEDTITLPMVAADPGTFIAHLENVRTDLLLHAHTRGHWSRSRVHRLTVLLTPQWDAAHLVVTPPSYTGLPEKKSPFTFDGIQVLKGSAIRFVLRSNRPLASGSATLTSSGGQETTFKLTPIPDQPETVSASLTAESSGRLTFSLTDIDSIPTDDTRSSSLTVSHDLPPQITIAQPAQDGFVVEGHPLTARITANDDYGLSQVRIHLGRDGQYAPPTEHRFGTLTRSESIECPLTTGPIGPPAGTVLTLFAEAIDNRPEPQLTRSEVRTLHVITREEYHDYLRQQNSIADLEAKYEKLFRAHQDLIEKQKDLTQRAAELAKTPDTDPSTKQQTLNQLQQEQAALNEQLLQSAEQMETFVSEAPLYDTESSFQEQLTQQAQQVRDSVAANQSAPKDQPTELSQAAQEHLERLGGAQEEAQEAIDHALADLTLLQELINGFNHFKALHAEQTRLTEQSAAYSEIAQVEETDLLALQNLGATERALGLDLGNLAAKLQTDATAAEETFPKAAASARQLANAIQKQRLDYLASQAASRLLRGEGRPGHQAARRLLDEMDALFSDCQNAEGGMGNELDTCLRLTHAMNPGSSFKQMMQCKKFGSGQNPGMAGQGQGGFMMGTGMASGNSQVFGGESSLGRNQGGQGDGDGHGSPGGGSTISITSSLNAAQPAQVSRATDAVPGTLIIEQYRSLTEAYFDRITGGTPPTPTPAKTAP